MNNVDVKAATYIVENDYMEIGAIRKQTDKGIPLLLKQHS